MVLTKSKHTWLQEMHFKSMLIPGENSPFGLAKLAPFIKSTYFEQCIDISRSCYMSWRCETAMSVDLLLDAVLGFNFF